MQLPEAPSFDLWTIIFVVAAAQGFFFAIMLATQRRGRRSANLLLAAFIFCFALTLFEYCLHWTRYLWHLPHINRLYMTLGLLFGPLLWLYCRDVGENVRLRWRDSWHFLPAALLLLNFLPFHFSDPDALRGLMLRDQELIKNINWPFIRVYHAYPYLLVVQMSVYTTLLYLLLQRTKEKVTEADPTSLVRQRWLRTLFGLFVGFFLANLSYYVLVATPYFSLSFDYQISLAMTVFIYTVGVLGYKQPEIFAGELLPKVFSPAPKYQRSSLTKAAAASMQKRLLQAMEEERVYRDSELRLGSLAEQLQISPHHLSQLINEKFGQSFPDFINHYRVREARQLLLAPQYRDTYIINIAYEVGFNNKTSFNKAFKSIVGQSPSQFKKHHISPSGQPSASK